MIKKTNYHIYNNNNNYNDFLTVYINYSYNNNII